MHRVLVIQIGRSFDQTLEMLRLTADERLSGDDLRVAFVTANAEAVGNLSHPVEVLRKRLEEDLADALSELLRRVPGRAEGFHLDIVVLTQYAEPMTTTATGVVVDMVAGIVGNTYAAVFPRRDDTASRWRFVMLGVLPEPKESRRDLDPIRVAVREHLKRLETRRDEGVPVGRVFLFDGVTPGGIAPLEELIDQSGNLVHLLIFSGLRREAIGQQLIDSACHDLVAAAGIARLSLPPGWLVDVLALRLRRDLGDVFARACRIAPGSVESFLTPDVFRDAEQRHAFADRLRQFVLASLREYGVSAAPALVEWLKPMHTLADRLAAEEADRQRQTHTTPATGTSRGPVATGLGIVLGGASFALAHMLIGLAVAASAGLAAAMAFIGALGVFAMMPKPEDATSKKVFTRPEGEPLPEEIAAQVQQKVAIVSSNLKRLHATFEGVLATSGARTSPLTSTTVFAESLASEALADELYKAMATDPESTFVRWCESLGPLEELFDGLVKPDADGLDAFCRMAFDAEQPIAVLCRPEARPRLSQDVERWLRRWHAGVALNLEIQTHQLRDPNGFRDVCQNDVLYPTRLQGTCEPYTAQASLRPSAVTLQDFYVVTATTDIHLESVYPFASERAHD